MTDVKIRMTAEDAASPKINQLKQSLSGLANSQSLMGGIVGGLIGGGMMGLANAAMQAAAAIPQMATELASVAAQAERTESSFVALSGSIGQSSQQMLASMREYTAGTVADTELMLAANRAMMLGVSDNAEEMSQLMAAAIERGRALGVSSQQAVNDIITGIGRMSPMILDNLGIVGVTQSVEDYARSLGKTAEALTDVERKQALVNAVIAQGSGGPILEDTASAFERMDASIANLKVALGELFGPAIAAIAQNLADAANATAAAIDFTAAEQAMAAYTQKLGELQALQEQLANLDAPAPIDASYAGVYDEVAAAERELIAAGVELTSTTDTTRAALEAKIAALQAAAAAARVAAIEAQGLKDITAQTKTEFDAAQAAAYAASISFGFVGGQIASSAQDMAIAEVRAQRLKGALAELAGQADNTGIALRGAFINASSALGAAGALSGFQAKQKELGLLRQEWQYMGLTTEQIAFKEAEFLGNTTAALRTQISAMDDLNSSAGRAASGGVSQLDSAMSDLQSRVQSMLSGALTPDVSIMDGLLPRTDDINENARRLAAIANEGIGDQSWMEEFKNEVPGIFEEIVNAANPQEAAARIFQEFQAGLRPELIDKGLVKERIKAAITGENSMAALAQEIATELAAEMNISLPEALKATQGAMGITADLDKEGGATAATATITPKFDLTGIAAAAAAAGAEFANGMNAPEAANKFSATFMLSMKDFYGRFFASGAASANEYNTGFLAQWKSTVPVEIVLTLATLVTPEVLAAIDARGSRTGATP
jgi:hypothetical protein